MLSVRLSWQRDTECRAVDMKNCIGWGMGDDGFVRADERLRVVKCKCWGINLFTVIAANVISEHESKYNWWRWNVIKIVQSIASSARSFCIALICKRKLKESSLWNIYVALWSSRIPIWKIQVQYYLFIGKVTNCYVERIIPIKASVRQKPDQTSEGIDREGFLVWPTQPTQPATLTSQQR